MALVVFRPLDLDGVDFLDVAVFVAAKFCGGGEINARIAAEFGCSLFLPIIHAINLRPFGPGIVLGAVQRRAGQNFQLNEAPALMAHRGANAVCASVAAADDDDVALPVAEM